MQFNASDWYWLADDGRVFSSARQTLVGEDDPGFAARRAATVTVDTEDGTKEMPDLSGWTKWPRDEAGVQTPASLQEVVERYRLTVPGAPRSAYGDDLITVLTDAELAAMSGGTVRDQRMLSAQRVPFRATDDIIVRLAAAMKVDPVAWFARLPASPAAA